ncbi:hypothetical protein OLMES_4386 [Oleiphilus messinensis]|uniref:Uncharacterized protein n=1 Tax=Oleiphilus messinensis TaxID=141451 RepID=A0A1Y0ICU9_9GAMM|nr:hypothetical protein OLMES_4386 [Oleiphilus messinensis]
MAWLEAIPPNHPKVSINTRPNRFIHGLFSANPVSPSLAFDVYHL